MKKISGIRETLLVIMNINFDVGLFLLKFFLPTRVRNLLSLILVLVQTASRKVSFLTELASSLYLTGLMRRLPYSTANLFTFLNDISGFTERAWIERNPLKSVQECSVLLCFIFILQQMSYKCYILYEVETNN